MELSVERCDVDLERGTVIITGYDVAEIIAGVGAKNLLQDMEYEDVLSYVAEVEEEKKELAEMAKENR